MDTTTFDNTINQLARQYPKVATAINLLYANRVNLTDETKTLMQYIEILQQEPGDMYHKNNKLAMAFEAVAITRLHMMGVDVHFSVSDLIKMKSIVDEVLLMTTRANATNNISAVAQEINSLTHQISEHLKAVSEKTHRINQLAAETLGRDSGSPQWSSQTQYQGHVFGDTPQSIFSTPNDGARRMYTPPYDFQSPVADTKAHVPTNEERKSALFTNTSYSEDGRRAEINLDGFIFKVVTDGNMSTSNAFGEEFDIKLPITIEGLSSSTWKVSPDNNTVLLIINFIDGSTSILGTKQTQNLINCLLRRSGKVCADLYSQITIAQKYTFGISAGTGGMYQKLDSGKRIKFGGDNPIKDACWDIGHTEAGVFSIFVLLTFTDGTFGHCIKKFDSVTYEQLLVESDIVPTKTISAYAYNSSTTYTKKVGTKSEYTTFQRNLQAAFSAFNRVNAQQLRSHAAIIDKDYTVVRNTAKFQGFTVFKFMSTNLDMVIFGLVDTKLDQSMVWISKGDEDYDKLLKGKTATLGLASPLKRHALDLSRRHALKFGA